MMLILGIDTSCDDTSAAIVEDGKRLISNVVSSQVNEHRHYGGVVPELASRMHIENIIPIVRHSLMTADVSLKDLGAIAVTRGPGLVGCLVVGLSYAKALAYSLGINFVGVNHLKAHLTAVFIEEDTLEYPFIGLVVSGGHTTLYRVEGPLSYHILGRTRDDAAGEAFDKVSRLLNLGYPGGIYIEEKASEGSPEYLHLPRGMLKHDSYDFSFSGIKTAVRNHFRSLSETEVNERIPHICASFEKAVVDVLVQKTIRAAREFNIPRIVISGGVAANRRLRENMIQQCSELDIRVYMPPRSLCTDNAAMVAVIGHHYIKAGISHPLSLDVTTEDDF